LGVVVLEVRVGLLLRGLIAWVKERGGGVSGLGHVEEHVLLLLLLLLVVVKVFWRGGRWWWWLLLRCVMVVGVVDGLLLLEV
jgi:hypothetical protein